MREIKFRVWDGEKMRFADLRSVGGLLQENRSTFPQYDPNWVDVDHPVMQYTGMKDKNGVEIYEGDVVRGQVWQIVVVVEEWIDVEGKVYYDDLSAAFAIEGRRGRWFLHDLEDGDPEVIGNIHKNPNLLN